MAKFNLWALYDHIRFSLFGFTGRVKSETGTGRGYKATFYIQHLGKIIHKGTQN